MANLTQRWHKRMAAIFAGVNWLIVLFCCPETRYNREEAQQISWTSSESSMRGSDEEGAPVKQFTPSEKSRPESPPGTPPATTKPRKTWIQQLSLWSGVPKDTSLIKLFIRPFPLIAYPAVILSFLGYAVALAIVVAVNILNSFVLQAPPYNWKPSINGLINIPGLLGNLFGAWAGGWLVDRYSSWRSKKNGGVFEPESRLTLLIIPGLIVPAGCLVFGYGVQETLHWITLFFGYGMIAVGLTAIPCITMTYVSDCVSDCGTFCVLHSRADLLVVSPCCAGCVVVGQWAQKYRGMLLSSHRLLKSPTNWSFEQAFGFLYGVVPWVTKVGYVDSFGTLAGIIVFLLALTIPLSLFGKQVRHKTSQWRIILQ